MRSRKIIGNLITALLIFPMMISYKRIGSVLTGHYRYEGDSPLSPWEYIYFTILRPLAYPLIPLLFLLLVLLPFQLIKDWYSKKGKNLSYLEKSALLFALLCIVVICCGLFSNIWLWPWYSNFIYLIYILGVSIIMVAVLQLLIDR